MLCLLVESDLGDAGRDGAEDESKSVVDSHARQHLSKVALKVVS